MPAWLLIALGITGVALVTHKPSGRAAPAPARRAAGLAPADGGLGFPNFGGSTAPAGAASLSGAASLGLSAGEFAGMTNTEGATDSTAASLGLSDQEWSNVNAPAASTDLSNSPGTDPNWSKPGDQGLPGDAYTTPVADMANASDASGDQSVDMGETTSTDVDPGFPGAEGTSVSGYHVGGPTETGAPPSWTDNGNGTATDPTGLMTMSYSDAWDYYDLNAFGMGAPSMQNQDGGVNLPAQSYDSGGNLFATVNGYRSYGEIHPSVGAPVVYDDHNNAYVMDGDGSVYPC